MIQCSRNIKVHKQQPVGISGNLSHPDILGPSSPWGLNIYGSDKIALLFNLAEDLF